MDLEVKIKEEPAWLEGITTASVENFEYVSEVIALKEEVKPELAEPGSLQENYLEPSKDIKEEIFIEEHTDDQLLAYIKEEMKSRSSKVSYADHQPTDGGDPCCRCSVCGKILAGKLGLLRHLKGHKYNHHFKSDHCENDSDYHLIDNAFKVLTSTFICTAGLALENLKILVQKRVGIPVPHEDVSAFLNGHNEGEFR
ncbi:uncharacterized protein [Anabrus simplex]|uniref:uncharacterized protein n=1 Tax=Anabrus simplex TaxID=316456 RepID=UPI0035A26E57